MELQVDICGVELRGSQNVVLTCTADNGCEAFVQRGSTNERAPTAAETASSQRSTTWPKFDFTFAASSPQVTLSFSVCDATTDIEAAKCTVHVPLQTRCGQPEDFLNGLKGRRTAILGTPIAGTDVARFAGKIRFVSRHTYTVPPPTSEDTPPCLPSRQRDVGSAHLGDLVAKETAALEHSVAFPDEDAAITVIFHALNLENAPDIKLIACPRGEITDEPGISRVFQGKTGKMQSILIQKKLRCNASETVGIYVMNQRTGQVLFHTPLPLASLQPFVYKHWCQPFMAGSSAASYVALVNRQSPGMIISAVLAVPKTSYPEHVGLEVCVKLVDPGFSTDYSRVVVCAQIMNKNGKLRFREPKTCDPPFDKGQQAAAESDRQDVYKMAVMNIAPRCEEVYFFFPADQEVHNTESLALKLSVYPVRPASSAPWWEVPQIGSASVDIAPVLPFLTQAKGQNGVHWEVRIIDPTVAQSSREQNRALSPSHDGGTVSAVLRWKTREAPFMSAAPELQSLPDLDCHMHTEYLAAGMPSVTVDPTPQGDLHLTHNEADLLLAQYRKAISQMGKDILQLRQQNALLMAENQRLQSRLESTRGGESLDYNQLEALGKHDLVQTVLLLQSELHAETAVRKETQNRAQGLQNLLTRQSDCETQYAELLEVHATQQRLVQRLQSKVQKLQRCYEICKQQQSIVNQLEALLAHQSTTRDKSLIEVAAQLQRDNGELRKNFQGYPEDDDRPQRLEEFQQRGQRTVEAELSQTLARCSQLEALLKQKEENASEGARNLELHQRLLYAETQVSTLRTELKENARKWATEKSHYEMKLAEYKTRFTTSDVVPTCTNSSGKVISF